MKYDIKVSNLVYKPVESQESLGSVCVLKEQGNSVCD